MTLVSVVIPVFNAALTLDRAIDSVEAQTMSDYEIIVADDGSDDGAVEALARRYAGDPRFQFIFRAGNAGPAAARNAAFTRARGTWIALLDADDAWEPKRLELLLGHADAADLIADGIITYDAHARETTGPMYPFLLERTRLTLLDHLQGRLHGREFDAGWLKPLIRADFVRRHGIVYDEALRTNEDYVYYCEALCRGALFVIAPEPTYIHTSPVGLKSGRRSPSSRTRPDPRAFGARLNALRIRYGPALAAAERQAFAGKLEALRKATLWWRFQLSRDGGDWWSMLRLATTSLHVQHRLGRAVVRTLLTLAGFRRGASTR
jgi:succinoglycan biosynthesis protein ExoO